MTTWGLVAAWAAGSLMCATMAVAQPESKPHAMGAAQTTQPTVLAAIPLEVGNYWSYDYVSVSDLDSTDILRAAEATRMEAEDLLYVLPVEENTLYSSQEEAFGEGGAPYYKLTFSDYLGFFPGSSVRTRPDGLLVRDHGDGSIWAKGWLRDSEVYVAAQEQPWFMISGPENYTFDLSGDVFTYFQERHDYGQSAHFGGLVELVGAFVPDLTLDTGSRVIRLRGESRCVHCGVNVTIVTGLGPVRSSAGFFEFRHFHYELSSAFVSGIRYEPDGVTTALPVTWGHVKRLR